MTWGAIRRKPLSLLSKGEKTGQEKMFPSMPKGENVENSCQLMSKESNNDKISEHNARGKGSRVEPIRRLNNCSIKKINGGD